MHDADIKAFTTFGVSARASVVATLHETSSLPALLAEPAIARAERRFVLGGGSNVLFTRDFDGLVLRVATRGIEVLDESSQAVRLRVSAGENWDAFVRWTLAEGYSGLENLIFIPGTVGGAPIQNIGAYGMEVAEFVSGVEAWDFKRGEWLSLSAEDCDFAYRDSRFKHEPGRFLVTAMTLDLPRERGLRLDYAGVREELQRMGAESPEARDVARAVETLRQRKLPDPARIGNAGSFFKNPVVSEAQASRIEAALPSLRGYPAGDGRIKLSAAGLIEACGFKGFREGDAGVSDKHALVLVNHGHASGADMWALAERVRAAVSKRFGIFLEPEPRVL
jgi:UDP-N-acetylmuramate dehydrogenase